MAKRSQLPPLPEKECLAWGDINAALTTGQECLQEDGAIFIGANIEGRGSINEPNSDVRNATLDHRDHYIYLVNVIQGEPTMWNPYSPAARVDKKVPEL